MDLLDVELGSTGEVGLGWSGVLLELGPLPSTPVEGASATVEGTRGTLTFTVISTALDV